MSKVIIHPNCIWCDNCKEIRPKKGYILIQDDNDKQENFCGDCVKDMDIQINGDVV